MAEIEVGSESVHAASSSLSARLIKIENWLGTLKGKVEAEVWDTSVPHPDGGDWIFGIQFHRDGKVWILSYHEGYYGQSNDDELILWKSLKDAPVTVKIRAVSLLPKLLSAIANEQKKIIESVTNAHDLLDAFETELGIKKNQASRSTETLNTEAF